MTLTLIANQTLLNHDVQYNDAFGLDCAASVILMERMSARKLFFRTGDDFYVNLTV